MMCPRENASQEAEIANGDYGAKTVTAYYVQFWFRRFRSGIFDVKDATHTGRPVVEKVDKITEIIEVDRHVSSRSIVQQLKIDHKTILSHLRKVGLKRSSFLGATPLNTKKTFWIEIPFAKPWQNGMKSTHFLNRW
ncbi:histone-lysine N-methyltransferase SETMAR [Trichonephila clavipes]|uniref:Histone-lysine N-methyltransferase SETMAR n=1 Tax=Trichonephila clavipes TaxID=2585209 RepID=A0A8X6SVQ3_TRICX|nr:histone-lysine N-methyltransferase SETMAR [Trichonephila clavipes]